MPKKSRDSKREVTRKESQRELKQKRPSLQAPNCQNVTDKESKASVAAVVRSYSPPSSEANMLPVIQEGKRELETNDKDLK